MRKILLPRECASMHRYRANLHAHTILSDGEKTPEGLKTFYKAHGYSILAITDHDLFIPHNDLSDKDFLLLNGYELDVNGANKMTCHMCLIAEKPDTDTDIFYHRTKYIPDFYGKAFGNIPNVRGFVKFDESKPDYEREYTPECISDMMTTASKNGFFVTYNHPTWSTESYPQYINYTGMDAMEISNYNCVVTGFDEHNSHCYDDFLRANKRIYCIAADDNHNHRGDDTAECDSFGGCTVICAEALEYEKITSALKNGMFYATTGTSIHRGPEIKSIEYDDGKVFVEASDAKNIICVVYPRQYGFINADYGKTVNSAEFTVGNDSVYFRIVVTDSEGYKAYSNAYFIDDLQK